MNMFFQGPSFGQQMGMEAEVNRANTKADRQSYKIDELVDKVDRLSLACQGMWELIRDRTQISEQDLEVKMLEIDARDGKVDGKITTQALSCHACGRPTNSKRNRCIMCGAALRRQHKFE